MSQLGFAETVGTTRQRGQVINQLAQNFKASTQAVENQILIKELPLRAKYVSCVSIPGRFF
jgi:hypothetical protein